MTIVKGVWGVSYNVLITELYTDCAPIGRVVKSTRRVLDNDFVINYFTKHPLLWAKMSVACDRLLVDRKR